MYAQDRLLMRLYGTPNDEARATSVRSKVCTKGTLPTKKLTIVSKEIYQHCMHGN